MNKDYEMIMQARNALGVDSEDLTIDEMIKDQCTHRDIYPLGNGFHRCASCNVRLFDE